MRFGCDWTQNSTKRGIVMFTGGLVSIVLIFMGKDPHDVMSVAMTIVGAMGWLIKDEK